MSRWRWSSSLNWDDLNRERSSTAMRACSESKIAFGLFGLELERRTSGADAARIWAESERLTGVAFPMT